MSRRSLAAARSVVAGALSLIAVAAHAQQIPASHVSRAMTALAIAHVIPADSVARYQSVARSQRRVGGALVVAGLATVAGAYAQFTHAGRMGMTGGQVATLAFGTGLGAYGATRWSAARESMAIAARWSQREVVAGR